MPQSSEYKIGMIGLWHLGEIFSVCLEKLIIFILDFFNYSKGDINSFGFKYTGVER